MNKEEKRDKLPKDIIELLEKTVKDLKFGSITIIIQDGLIIQIEKTKNSGLNKGYGNGRI